MKNYKPKFRIVSDIIKKEPVLSVAAILAVCSAFMVPPDKMYIDYCSFDVLSVLFCLMLVVAGFGYCGVFDALTHSLTQKIKSEKAMIFCMTLVCFFSSCLITNDVALITFVPFTMALLRKQKSNVIIFAVTMLTVAANLGSVITPVGNPQNLFLYTHYNLSIGEFMKITLPLGIICLGLICVIFAFVKNNPLEAVQNSQKPKLLAKPLILYVLLFLICIGAVLKIIPWYIVLIICTAAVCIHKPSLLREADYMLLITFVCFFVFVGNVARIDAVYKFVSSLIDQRELVVSAFLSQLISNVPAATMLASFTDKYGELILGVNIGGLGTLIASMASLISYRQICKAEKISNGKYIGFFSIVNVCFLIILLVIYSFIA
ncbi:MAG: anion permease [Clostridia bacterium]|nr:anion permease [Clostridia bacterium]